MQNLVTISLSGKITTTTFKIADKFGVQHDNVLHVINAIYKNQPEFSAINFSLLFKNNDSNNARPIKYYEVTQAGFYLLDMAIAGEMALQLKVDYINAFESLRNHIFKQEVIKASASSIDVMLKEKKQRTIGFAKINADAAIHRDLVVTAVNELIPAAGSLRKAVETILAKAKDGSLHSSIDEALSNAAQGNSSYPSRSTICSWHKKMKDSGIDSLATKYRGRIKKTNTIP